jgi:hypothetical protein
MPIKKAKDLETGDKIYLPDHDVTCTVTRVAPYPDGIIFIYVDHHFDNCVSYSDNYTRFKFDDQVSVINQTEKCVSKKSKLILKQSDGRSRVIESDLPLEKTVINWYWEHDPLFLMPCLSVISFCVFFPLIVLALLLALLANIANYLVKILVILSNGLNDFCYTATDNHTRLSIIEDEHQTEP